MGYLIFILIRRFSAFLNAQYSLRQLLLGSAHGQVLTEGVGKDQQAAEEGDLPEQPTKERVHKVSPWDPIEVA